MIFISSFNSSLKKNLYSKSSSNFAIFVCNFRHSLKKSLQPESSSVLSIFVPKLRIKLCFINFCPQFFDYVCNNCHRLDIARLLFSKSFVLLLGFSKFHVTKHKNQFVLQPQNFFMQPHLWV